MMKLHTNWVTRSILTTGISVALGAASAAAQTPAPTAAFGPDNPFYAPSTLPFQAPPFDKIKDSDYQPAIDAGMAQQIHEVEAIANNPAPPTFENTIVALERTGQLLTRVTLVFNCVTGANTNDELQKVQAYEAPRLAAQQDAINLNAKLFARVKAVYDQRASLHLDPESLRLVEYDYQQFVKAGANLSDADKAKLKKLNEEESTLETDFMDKLLAATKAAAYATTDKTALAGLSDADMAVAADAAAARKQPGWVIPLQNTTQQPDFTDLTNRATRKALFEASWNRTERGDANDTRATIARLAQFRAEKAALLGYKNFAAWNLSDQMAKTPEAAIKFLDGLAPASVAHAENEAKEIQALMDAEHGRLSAGAVGLGVLQPKGAQGKVRSGRVARSSPTSRLNNVLENGVFYAAHELYGLTFKERHDIPVWHPDVRVFEVFDADGKPLALWYCDYFKRDNKNGGAWMDNLVSQSKLLGTVARGLQRGQFREARARPARLLSFDEVTTMFHEFGHALHGMFADTMYPSLSGTQVPRDFVEFPSQFNEHWASYPAVFAHYAKHYKTGEPMPAELVAKIGKSETFNQGPRSDRDYLPHPSSISSGTLCPRARPSRIPTSSRPKRSSGRISTSATCRRATAPATSCTSGPTATTPATTPTCGARCSTTTPSSGSWITAA